MSEPALAPPPGERAEDEVSGLAALDLMHELLKEATEGPRGRITVKELKKFLETHHMVPQTAQEQKPPGIAKTRG